MQLTRRAISGGLNNGVINRVINKTFRIPDSVFGSERDYVLDSFFERKSERDSLSDVSDSCFGFRI